MEELKLILTKPFREFPDRILLKPEIGSFDLDEFPEWKDDKAMRNTFENMKSRLKGHGAENVVSDGQNRYVASFREDTGNNSAIVSAVVPGCRIISSGDGVVIFEKQVLQALNE